MSVAKCNRCDGTFSVPCPVCDRPQKSELDAAPCSALLAERDDLRKQLAKKQSIIETNSMDWADDDTSIKKIAAAVIPGYSPDEQSDGYFVNVVEVAERMASEITLLREQLSGAVKCEVISEHGGQ